MAGWRTLRAIFLLLLCCACPVSAAAQPEESLPYGGLVSEERAAALAQASAWEQAVAKAGMTLAADKVIQMAELGSAETEALALQLGMVKVPETETRRRQGMVRARAVTAEPGRPPSQALGERSGRERRAEMLAEMRSLLPEALLLVRKAATLRRDNGPGGDAVVMERLTFLSDQISALMAYLPLLDEYGLAWNDPASLLPRLEALRARAPLSPTINTALGELYLQNDRPLAALEALNAAMRQQPGHRVLSLRGMAQWWLGRPALAEEDLNRALALQPEQVDYWLVRGGIRRDREAYGPMCDDYRRACVMGQCEALSGARELCNALDTEGD